MADILVLDEEDIANSDVGSGSEQCRLYMSLRDGTGWTSVADRDRDIQDINPNDTLTAVERLEKYIAEQKSTNKRAVAQAVVDTLRVVSRESPQDVTVVLQILSRLAEDSDSQLRTDMMVQVPQIALLCYEIAGQLAGVVEGHLLPLVIKTLTDIEESVRKTAQTALIMLMEQNLVTCEAIEDQVCPVVLMLADMGTLPDYHSNAVMPALMSKGSTYRIILRWLCEEEIAKHMILKQPQETASCHHNCESEIYYIVCLPCRQSGSEMLKQSYHSHFDELGVRCNHHLMSKIAPLIGREKAMELFLDHFVALCSDPALFVRTVCAANIGDFCTLMGTEVTEHVLLPCFVQLCKDGIWGVRKECANVFLSVSCVVTLATRKNVLAPIFVELLRDQSRWVKVAAFHSLGPFIWTFAPDSIRSQEPHSPAIDPDTPRPQRKTSRVRLLYGVETIGDPLTKYMNDSDPCFPYKLWDVDEYSEKNEGSSTEADNPSDANVNVSGVESKGGEDSCKSEAIEQENDFNTFLYWRLPLPEVEPDASIGSLPKAESNSILTTSTVSTTVTTSVSTGSPNGTSPCAKGPSTRRRQTLDDWWPSFDEKFSFTGESGEQKPNENTIENKDKNFDGKPSISQPIESEDAFKEENVRIDEEPKQGPFVTPCSNATKSDSEGSSQAKTAQGQAPLTQDIVPQALIDHYISMSTPLQFNDEDPELAHHCAFNFPAVALTLGRENWPILNDSYELLAVDVQWKVRRTLASSIHELAVILGEDLATRYLVPVFNGFSKDLDEVRIGVVKHLADFLKLIGPAGRNECLPYLFNLLMTDNQLNWRFRDELTRQLMQVTNLFSPKDVRRFLSHMGMALLFCKVAAVRHKAMLLLAEHVRYLSVDKKLVGSLLVKLAKEFARSAHWMRRQSYALLCEQLLVPRSRQAVKTSGDADDDEEEEGVDRGHYGKRDSIQDEWIDERLEDMSWRTSIAPLLAQHMYPYLLDLSCDKVPNVRLAVARVLSSFQATPAEQSYLQSYLDEAGESDGSDTKRVPALDMALAQLQKDSDRDVRYFASANHLSCFSGRETSAQSQEEEVDVVNGLISPL